MGGDAGPSVVISALGRSVQRHPGIKFILHGDETALNALLKKRLIKIAHHVSVRHAEAYVRMDEKPSLALRRGRKTSMWRAIESVKNGEAEVVVSAGNTGALMAMSMYQLGVIEGISRPAIAAYVSVTVLTAWNMFIWPLVATTDLDLRVLPIALSALVTQRSLVTPNLSMMAVLLSTLPIIAIFIKSAAVP